MGSIAVTPVLLLACLLITGLVIAGIVGLIFVLTNRNR